MIYDYEVYTKTVNGNAIKKITKRLVTGKTYPAGGFTIWCGSTMKEVFFLKSHSATIAEFFV